MEASPTTAKLGSFTHYSKAWKLHRNRLFVHSNGDLFDRLPADQHRIDRNQYSLPEEIVLQLTHKDVFLSFFKGVKQEVLALRSGDALTFADGYFLAPATHRAVARLSTNMLATLSIWRDKGYEVRSASVRFVVAWKPKDEPKEAPETAVLLIDLTLSALGHYFLLQAPAS